MSSIILLNKRKTKKVSKSRCRSKSSSKIYLKRCEVETCGELALSKPIKNVRRLYELQMMNNNRPVFRRKLYQYLDSLAKYELMYNKRLKITQLIGYKWKEIVHHIENYLMKIDQRMEVSNFGWKGWVIDFIKPPEEIEGDIEDFKTQKKIFHLHNLKCEWYRHPRTGMNRTSFINGKFYSHMLNERFLCLNHAKKQLSTNKTFFQRLFTKKVKKSFMNSTKKYSKDLKFTLADSYENLLGCTFEEFSEYLSKYRFEKGMNYRNHGGKNGYHICKRLDFEKFNLENPEDQYAFFHFTNHICIWLDKKDKTRRYLNKQKLEKNYDISYMSYTDFENNIS